MDPAGTHSTEHMSARTHTARRLTCLALQALLATCLGVLCAAPASAQRAGGSIGVSLTVLPPVVSRPVEVTSFRMNADGTATLRTTAPTTSPVSQLVMTRVSSSAIGFAPVTQSPAVVRGGDDHTPRELSYRFDLGRSAAALPSDVQLRIEYLTVAGT